MNDNNFVNPIKQAVVELMEMKKALDNDNDYDGNDDDIPHPQQQKQQS